MNITNLERERTFLAIKSISKNLLGSAIFQLLLGFIIIALGIVGKLIQTDVLFFPPFLILTMGYTIIWQTIGILVIFLSICQIIFAYIYRKNFESKSIKLLFKFFIGFQLINIPIGTFFAIYELFTQKDLKIIEISKNGKQMEHIRLEIGHILIYSAIILLGFLTMVYLLTIFLSTMMLDITYPYLTMAVLLKLRVALMSLSLILCFQILLGILYPRNWQLSRIQFLVRIFCILQIGYFPLGTYASAIILKELKHHIPEK